MDRSDVRRTQHGALRKAHGWFPDSCTGGVLHLPFTAVLFALSAIPAQTQTLPDAGSLLQQIERENKVAPKSVPQLPTVPRPQELKSAPGLTVVVKRFRFAGNSLYTDAQLASVVAGFLDRPLGFDELQQAVAAVTARYRRDGWIVRAYLPKQGIDDGVVNLQIIEAVFGRVHLEAGSATRMKLSSILGIFEKQLAKGQPVNAEALDRALLLADDLPGVLVSGSLRGGQKEQETDLVLKLADEPMIVGDAAIENAGSSSTGRIRGIGNAVLNSPASVGDLLAGNLMHADGIDYGRLAYTVPVGRDGWRFGGSVSTMRYKVITREFAALSISGTSDTVGLEADYPIIRSQLKNLSLGLSYDRKSLVNQSAGSIQSHYETDGLTISLDGNLLDRLGGGGANRASLAWVQGRLLLGTLDAGENAALNGGYKKLRYAASRLQLITDNLALHAGLTGQVARQTLDSSEKFCLGGPTGVRAYPVSEGSGASGQLANLELRWRLPDGFTVTGFLDHGHVRNDDGSRSYSLKGGGLAVAWQTGFGLNLKAVWARRIGANPNPSTAGLDQDGTLEKNRWWLTASQAF